MLPEYSCPRRIRNTIDQTTACTIATSLIHSKIDFCNSLLLNLPATQTNRLQLVVNSLTLLLVLSPKLLNFITLLLFLNLSMHWLKINERIKYKVLSLSHINLSKLFNLLTSALFRSLHIVVLGLPVLSPLVALLSPLILK